MIIAILAVLFVLHMTYGFVYITRLNKKQKPAENAVCVMLYLAFIWPIVWKVERDLDRFFGRKNF